MSTLIEWVRSPDGSKRETWNPITGCTAVSKGCVNCCARRISRRFAGRYGYPKDEPFRVVLHHNRLEYPLKWKKPKTIFLCSMSDFFHEEVPTSFIDDVLEVIAACPQHTFLVLTKRPEKIEEKMYGITPDNPCRELGGGDYLPNLWLGTTVESPEYLWRIDKLCTVPAVCHFVSFEPLLEKVSIAKKHDCIDWVIAAPESGPNRRHYELRWFQELKDECVRYGIPFFLKHLYLYPYNLKMRIPLLDGSRWCQFPKIGNFKES